MYYLIEDSSKEQGSHRCYVGGRPRLPQGTPVPTCSLCGSEQTFMFQVTFEIGEWKDWVVASFLCTSCVDERHLIPEMPALPLRGANPSNGFLESYQKNFRFLVFRDLPNLPEVESKAPVKLKTLAPVRKRPSRGVFAQVGGRPKWVLGDESPDRRFVFLMNIFQDYHFEIEKSAPGQLKLGLSGAPEVSRHRYYKLFLANSIYLYGNQDRQIYAFTQVD